MPRLTDPEVILALTELIRTLDPQDLAYMVTPAQCRHLFELEMDNMVESTDEFIADDRVTFDDDPENRLLDRFCLTHIRKLWDDAFAPVED